MGHCWSYLAAAQERASPEGVIRSMHILHPDCSEPEAAVQNADGCSHWGTVLDSAAPAVQTTPEGKFIPKQVLLGAEFFHLWSRSWSAPGPLDRYAVRTGPTQAAWGHP